MDLKNIENLLQSEDKQDLEKARLETRKLLTEMTSKIVSIFLDRLKLMGLIASSKRKSDSILQLDREYELIQKFSNIAKESGENEKMVEMLIWLITSAGKEKQRKILNRDSVFLKENLSKEQLLKNLLELTKKIAPYYNEYGEGFSATKLAKEFENKQLEELIDNINDKDLAIDLGCANGTTTRLLSGKGFKKVIGFDISEDMKKEAEKRKKLNNEEYKKVDLFNGIPLENNSVSLLVSNFGTASQIDIDFEEIKRVLKSGGKAYLSFYNSDYLNSSWWQPWQGSLEPIKNPEDDILEVPLEKDGKIETYKIFAKSVNEKEIISKADKNGLKIESIKSHSLITSMMPPIFFEDKNRVKQVIEYEKFHSKQRPFMGFYLTVILSK